MRRLLAKIGKVGPRQSLALLGTAVLAAAAIALAFTEYPAYSVVPLALMLFHLTAQVTLMQHRLLHGFRDVRYRFKKHLPLSRTPIAKTAPAAAPRIISEAALSADLTELLERVEYNQHRVLASIETERIEAAERQQALLKLTAKLLVDPPG